MVFVLVEREENIGIVLAILHLFHKIEFRLPLFAVGDTHLGKMYAGDAEVHSQVVDFLL